MKVKLALVLAGALVICFLPGCRDFTAEEYHQAQADRAAAEGKVAGLEEELEVQKATVADLQTELEARQAEIDDLEAELEARQAQIADLEAELEGYPAQIADLEAELETYLAQIADLETELETYLAQIADLEAQLEAAQEETTTTDGTTEETPEPSIPLDEEDFRYRGFEGRLVSVHVAAANATWTDNKVTVSLEITNTSTRKIYLDLLQVEAYDQMYIWGEWEITEEGETTVGVSPLAIYPTWQEDRETLWPGETLRFDTEWTFGPLSDEITVKFSVIRTLEDKIKYASDDVIPLLTVIRPSS